MRTPTIMLRAALAALAAVTLVVPGIGRDDGRHLIRVWCHQGQEAENAAMRKISDAFNQSDEARGGRIDLAFFPDFQFTEKLAIAAAAGDLPDAFDLDGPLVTRFADAGLVQALEPWFDAVALADFLPTIREQGTVNGHVFALGAFDSALVLYYDKAMLAAAGVAPPPTDRGWTWEEFLAACARLRAAGIEPVALHMNESADEWYTYAFSPLIWSGGGRLISPDGRQARGVLASRANIRTLQAWQKIFTAGYAATDPVDPDPFGHEKTAMDWSGHWMARSHLAAKGARLGVAPIPRAGAEDAAACGSWCWAMSARTHDPQLAAAWLRWVTDPRHGVEPMVRANGAVPARLQAFAAFPEYQGPPYRLFREELEAHGHPRPHTPYYATLTRHFAAALRDIARGADPGTRLRDAEDAIQKVIDRHEADRPTAAARKSGVAP